MTDKPNLPPSPHPAPPVSPGVLASETNKDRNAKEERCAVPGCDTLTSRGICDECDAWVDEQVALLNRDEGRMNDAIRAVGRSPL